MAEFGTGLLCGGLLKLMEALYAAVDGMRATDGLCTDLAARVRLIEGSVRSLEVLTLPPERLAPALTQLQSVLLSALALVDDQRRASSIRRFFGGGSVRKRFDEVHRRLTLCQTDLSVPLQRETLCMLQTVATDAAAARAAVTSPVRVEAPPKPQLEFERREDGTRVKIGAGSRAVVYKARLQSEPVAVKVYREGGAAAAAEAALRDIRHPNLVTVLGAYSLPDTVRQQHGVDDALIMLYEPATLAQSLYSTNTTSTATTTPSLTETEALDTARSVLAAIAYLSACDPPRIHTDIKPSNVLLTHDQGDAKLGDLDSCVRLGDAAVDVTPAFAAPEIVAADDALRPTPAAMLFSWGVLVAECFAAIGGRRGSWAAEAVPGEKLARGDALPALPDALPPTLRAVVEACMRTDPATRPPIADVQQAVARDASAVLDHVALAPSLPHSVLRAAATNRSRRGSSASATTTSHPPAVRARLVRFYEHHAPAKLPGVDAVLDAYAGAYPMLFERLVAKYGPEPSIESETSCDEEVLADRIRAFYATHAPEKQGNAEAIAAAYAGREADLFAMLEQKYGATATTAAPVAASEEPATVPRGGKPSATSTAAEKSNQQQQAGGIAEAPSDVEPLVSAASAAPSKAVTGDARMQLLQFYEHHCPDKVSTVDAVLQRFAGRESDLFASLAIVYGAGAEYVPATAVV